jgi:hypothetical protein
LVYRHKSIIAYLASANLTQSSAALREELGDSITVDDTTLKKYEGLLEKKWTSIVRLQKKVGYIPKYCTTREFMGLIGHGAGRLWTWNRDAPPYKLK